MIYCTRGKQANQYATDVVNLEWEPNTWVSKEINKTSFHFGKNITGIIRRIIVHEHIFMFLTNTILHTFNRAFNIFQIY